MTAAGRPPVLADPALDRALAEEGHVVVPLLDEAEVAALAEVERSWRREGDPGLTIDFMREDRAAARAVAEAARPVWDRCVPELFDAYRPVVSTFVVKHPGDESAMGLHHEATYVAPGAGRASYNVWVPLVDTGPELDNGPLEVVPGTQHLDFGLVGFDTPVGFRPFEAYLLRHAVPLTVPAGSAAVYDSRMLHASGPNRSDEARPALAASMVPAEGELIHVVSTGPRGRRVHLVDEGFFVDLHPAAVPDAIADRYGPGEAAVDDPTLDPVAVAAAVGSDQVPEPQPVLPWDLDGEVDAARRLPDESVGDDRTTSDEVPGPVVPRVVDLPGPGTGVEVSGATGDVATVDLASVGTADLPDELSGLGRRGTLAVLDPGGRLRLGPREQALRAVTLQAPAVHAGVVAGRSWAPLEPGRAVDLSGHDEVTVWNEGPGAALVVLDPARRSLRDRLFGRR